MVRLAIAYKRLADRDRTDSGHHLAFRQVTVARDALVAVHCLQIGMVAKKSATSASNASNRHAATRNLQPWRGFLLSPAPSGRATGKMRRRA
jgi:hypothetical protein